jgi:hypothetical protein
MVTPGGRTSGGRRSAAGRSEEQLVALGAVLGEVNDRTLSRDRRC